MDNNIMLLMEKAKDNFVIQDSFSKAHSMISRYDDIFCLNDNDVVVDICKKIDVAEKIHYVPSYVDCEYDYDKNALFIFSLRSDMAIKETACVSHHKYIPDFYRPIFWYMDKDLDEYRKLFLKDKTEEINV